MKRLAVVASVLLFAACSPKAEEAAPADTAAPAAAVDTTVTYSTKTDSTKTDSTHTDSAAH